MRVQRVLIMALLCLAVSTAEAGIHYLPERDVLWVMDFPQARPCTPELLAFVDGARGWNRVAYDEAAQTCTVSCDLYIGRNDGSSTWFQVGSAERPTETLIVRGDLRVYSTWLAEENTESMYLGRQRTNRLTLGIPDDPSITASLLIDNEERAGHTIVIGGFSGYGSENQGGDLCAYHATIGPAGEVPVGQNERGANQMTFGGAGTVEVIDCVVRGIAGRAFGAQFTAGRFERTRFENCGVALHGNYQEIVRGCIFTGCGTGIIAGGAVRQIVEVSGIRDILTKSLGSGNVFNRAMACFKALEELYNPEEVASRREMSVEDLLGRKVVDPYAEKEKTEEEEAVEFEEALSGDQSDEDEYDEYDDDEDDED